MTVFKDMVVYRFYRAVKFNLADLLFVNFFQCFLRNRVNAFYFKYSVFVQNNRAFRIRLFGISRNLRHNRNYYPKQHRQNKQPRQYSLIGSHFFHLSLPPSYR